MKKPLTPEEFVKIAREIPRDERVPYAFEKRVMAHLASAAVPDALSLWTRALWRAVAPCFGIMLIAAAVSFASHDQSAGATANDNDLDLDSAVLTPSDVSMDLSV
jgi:hypothetical protein